MHFYLFLADKHVTVSRYETVSNQLERYLCTHLSIKYHKYHVSLYPCMYILPCLASRVTPVASLGCCATVREPPSSKPLTGLNMSTDTKEPRTSDRKYIISIGTNIIFWMFLCSLQRCLLHSVLQLECWLNCCVRLSKI